MRRQILVGLGVIFLSLPALAFAQTITGIMQDAYNKPIEDAQITLKNLKRSTRTDSTGRYSFTNLAQGKYTLIASSLGKKKEEKEVVITDKTVEVNFLLIDSNKKLEVVILEGEKEGETHLRSIENFGIYEGKKTEIINLKDISANLSTNNPRQVYSKITGLNIWESDGAGLQLGIGGRGLSPNRTSSFNTRQNGYDISADALGYPESYYTPPTEALERIEIVRGAASLQYGTQFGGMLNFKFKRGEKDKKIELTSRQSVGSWGYFGSFNSLGGTVGKLNYYVYHQYKTGAGYRPNSSFNHQNAYISLQYAFSQKLLVTFDLTKMHYLAQQAGGLTDKNFQDNPKQSVRNRNWFQVNWNLACLQLTYQIAKNSKINMRTFGLLAKRQSVGNLERINVADFGDNRTLIDGDFKNVGTEIRFLQNYSLKGQNMAFLAGVRLYRGVTTAQQGEADNSSRPNFLFINPDNIKNSAYTFPNENYAFFAENIFNITHKISITPGIRLENIQTFAEGYYKLSVFDGAGNLIVENKVREALNRKRSFALVGLGISYKAKDYLELYGNFSQNYRAINFTDLRIVNPNLIVDINIQDEKGYTADLGVRGAWAGKLRYELTAFYIAYKDRIGRNLGAVQPYRGNIADARNIGVEFFTEWQIISNTQLKNDTQTRSMNLSAFVNFAWIDSRNINTPDATIRNKRVEMVPPIMLRIGTTWKYQNLACTLQWGYTGEHFSDATNAIRTATAVEGVIPAYQVADFSVRYAWKMLTFEGSINNMLNAQYFTRRAESYPGPGIIPADGRGFYGTIQAKF